MTKKTVNHQVKTIVVLGISGMLGHKVFEVLSRNKNYNVWGTVTRLDKIAEILPANLGKKVIPGVFADKIETYRKIIQKKKPDVVVNCIGIIKQKNNGADLLNLITVNAQFPHLLAQICTENSAKLITVSTDCVFDGQKGSAYLQDELPTCHDAYGMSKYLGEVNYDQHLTLRISLIGHELFTNVSLLDWFLSVKENSVNGFKKAVFSGFTNLEFAKLLEEKIIPARDLHGLYHFSVNPINKYDLITKIAAIYHKNIKIIADDKVDINRALDSTPLRNIINYQPPSWEQLIQEMYQDFLTSPFYLNRNKNYD